MFPGLPYYIEIKSNNKKNLMGLVKQLNLKVDDRKHVVMGPIQCILISIV